MKKRVWTRAYSPFIMGGDVHQPICADLEVLGPVTLEKKIKGRTNTVTFYQTMSPKKKVYYIEKRTGGLMGSSLLQIQKDFDSADPAVLREQLVKMEEYGKTARPVSSGEFWERVEK